MYKAPKRKTHLEYPVLDDLLNDLHHNLQEQNVFSYLSTMYTAFISLKLRIISSPSHIFISLQATEATGHR